MIVALSGGVGGAKLVQGFSLAAVPLSVVVNTADDFEHLGLRISPDLDSVMYALAGLADAERGWGVREESWNALEMLARYEAPTWFQLGDRDLATHLLRTMRLQRGETLTEVTAQLCRALGIRPAVLPMCNTAVQTQVSTPQGWLDFQTYFVKERCQPQVQAVRFTGIESATPSAEVLTAIAAADLIVLCPSNPLVSLDPILNVPGMLEALQAAAAAVVAVSPLIQGRAIKGPTVEMLNGLGFEATPLAVAQRYQPFLDGFVLDHRDTDQRVSIEALGLTVVTTETLMETDVEKKHLAERIVEKFHGCHSGDVDYVKVT